MQNIWGTSPQTPSHSLTTTLWALALAVTAVQVPGTTAALDEIPDLQSEWTEQGEVIVTTPSDWDEKSLQIFGISKKNGIYYLYYGSGFDGCWDQHADVAHKSVGVATSTDGMTFVKHPDNPVLIPHDFVPVSAHEEGIRLGRIRYIEELGKFVGYFGVEDPGGSDGCGYRATSGCDCNISVDAYVYTASSIDGITWTPEGEVNGAYNVPGNESYGSAFEYAGGNYYLWSHYASGGHTFHASKGTVSTDLTELGVVPELNFGWSPLETFLHDDGNTVTFIYVPNGPDYEGDELRFATCTLDNPTVVTDVRLFTNESAHRFSALLKDDEAGLWRWYYGVGAATDPILQRTAPIEDANSSVDPVGGLGNSVLKMTIHPNPFGQSAEIRYALPEAQQVKISVHDISGRLVQVLQNEQESVGEHRLEWSADESLPSGTYLLSIEAGPHREKKRVVYQR